MMASKSSGCGYGDVKMQEGGLLQVCQYKPKWATTAMMKQRKRQSEPHLVLCTLVQYLHGCEFNT
jgi:hypothetical protein